MQKINTDRRKLLSSLEEKLSVSFENPVLLNEALTHSSYASDHKEVSDYERLEFFGDAVLKFVVSEYLFLTYPDYNEGRLTEIRAVLVNAKTLELVADTFDLKPYLLVARGIPIRTSMLARSMEAILGAIYLDQGMNAAREFICAHFCSRAESVDLDSVKDNYKAQLQQFTQSRAQGVPKYTVVKIEGPPHDSIFTVAVSVEGVHLSEGRGHSKKSAEQEAAKLAYAKIYIPATESSSASEN